MSNSALNITSPWMSEDAVMLQDSVRKVLEKEFYPHREQWEDDGIVNREAWLKAGEFGLLCPSIPEEFGGGGGSKAHDAVLAQEVERAGLGGGFGIGIGTHCMVAHYILDYASDERRNEWLPKMASGELIGAVAMTEPGTGSDLQAIKTKADKVPGGYRINGQKIFISNGQNADLIITVCRTGETGSKGISLLVVEAGAEGFKRGRNLKKIGLPAQDTSELFFDDVFVPDENLLGGQEGGGFYQLMNQLMWERMLTTLGAVVSMELAVQYTVEYVKSRTVFGKAVMDYQNTQFKLAECKTQAHIARVFVDQLMLKLLDGTLDNTSSAMGKWWATDTQFKVLDECLQLHGGYGYMTEYPIARLWRDARVLRIWAGTNEIMKVIVARDL
ncbi:MAG: acyl-CoA dehydrogenase family protein [Parasphingorhabdus sp.]|uniref:acyl-CoA dehydrogenase family protein n=1 Tax=Parasphingorhabdus sp. TaxID=2709688 RepID=UPI003002E65D